MDTQTMAGLIAILVASSVAAFAVTCAVVLSSRISRRQGE